MSTISKRATAARAAALDRPELRNPSSPREPTPTMATMPIKVQRSPQDQGAIQRYLESKRLAQIGKDFAREGIEVVDEAFKRVGAKR